MYRALGALLVAVSVHAARCDTPKPVATAGSKSGLSIPKSPQIVKPIRFTKVSSVKLSTVCFLSPKLGVPQLHCTAFEKRGLWPPARMKQDASRHISNCSYALYFTFGLQFGRGGHLCASLQPHTGKTEKADVAGDDSVELIPLGEQRTYKHVHQRVLIQL